MYSNGREDHVKLFNTVDFIGNADDDDGWTDLSMTCDEILPTPVRVCVCASIIEKNSKNYCTRNQERIDEHMLIMV